MRYSTRSLLHPTLPLLTVVALASCGLDVDLDPAVSGSGTIVTEALPVAAFERLEVSDGLEVEVRIGPAPALQVTGDDNLLPLLRVRSQGDALRLDVERPYRSRERLRVALSTPALREVGSSGSSDVRARGFTGPSFGASASGSGSVLAEGQAERLDAHVSGSGSVGVAGVAHRVRGSVSGSGKLDLRSLRARVADLRLSGSGDAVVNASDSLRADVSGSGDVRFLGHPRTRASVSGSGSIRRI